MGVSVNDFSAESLKGKIYSKYSTNPVDTNVTGSDANYLDFDGYLKLLTSQMANQDFNNSMSDSEFIQQMASYSMMEAISQLTQQTALSYNSSLIGKAVTISDGSSPETGLVEAVTVTSDGCKLLVNGTLYSADSVTDVVDGTVYSQLRTFVGHDVEIKDGDDTITGKVTGILIKNGNGYVTLDNKNTYSMDAITNVIADEETEEGAEENAAENAEAAADESVQTAAVEETTAGTSNTGEISGTVHSSQQAYNTLLSMIDETNDEDEAIEAEFRTAQVQSRMSSYLSADVTVSDASSGLNGDNSRIPAPYGASQAYASQSAAASGLNGDNSRIPAPYGASQATAAPANTVAAQTAYASNSYDRGDVSGVTTVSGSNAESTSVEQYIMDTPYTDMPHSNRRYADSYPVEAAFADSVGTNMTDIRFIGNTEINSRIIRDNILCYSPSGRAVTDIGWCGKGRLGEVVTFADGTQRVEIIGPTEVSYLYTTGNFTLDQICDFNCRPGEYTGKLSDFEIAIRHYAREYTAQELREMKEFGEYAVWHAATQYSNPLAMG